MDSTKHDMTGESTHTIIKWHRRQQWNDGSNTLAIAPATVITYERNYVTNDLLEKKGIKVITMPSSELSRGRGGPRCMSCPVNRDDL